MNNIKSGAKFSKCGMYRYSLWRRWVSHDDTRVLFIMLNPSTADETENDPTITRCIGYAQSWGFGELVVCNLFAYRSTDPKHIKYATDPVGADNNALIIEQVMVADLIVCAWGSRGSHLGRSEEVMKLIKGYEPHYLKMTKSGEPSHPLYLKKVLTPLRFD